MEHTWNTFPPSQKPSSPSHRSECPASCHVWETGTGLILIGTCKESPPAGSYYYQRGPSASTNRLRGRVIFYEYLISGLSGSTRVSSSGHSNPGGAIRSIRVSPAYTGGES